MGTSHCQRCQRMQRLVSLFVTSCPRLSPISNSSLSIRIESNFKLLRLLGTECFLERFQRATRRAVPVPFPSILRRFHVTRVCLTLSIPVPVHEPCLKITAAFLEIVPNSLDLHARKVLPMFIHSDFSRLTIELGLCDCLTNFQFILFIRRVCVVAISRFVRVLYSVVYVVSYILLRYLSCTFLISISDCE